jgi:hypothetical protein
VHSVQPAGLRAVRVESRSLRRKGVASCERLARSPETRSRSSASKPGRIPLAPPQKHETRSVSPPRTLPARCQTPRPRPGRTRSPRDDTWRDDRRVGIAPVGVGLPRHMTADRKFARSSRP